MSNNRRGPRINRIVKSVLGLVIQDRVEDRIEKFVNPRDLIAGQE